MTQITSTHQGELIDADSEESRDCSRGSTSIRQSLIWREHTRSISGCQYYEQGKQVPVSAAQVSHPVRWRYDTRTTGRNCSKWGGECKSVGILSVGLFSL